MKFHPGAEGDVAAGDEHTHQDDHRYQYGDEKVTDRRHVTIEDGVFAPSQQPRREAQQHSPARDERHQAKSDAPVGGGRARNRSI